jgi:hypothetical protein
VKILRYSEFDSSKRTVPANNESEGVSRAIMGHLEDFLGKAGKDASFEEASQYIASKVEGWKLSKEDFEEAKAMMSENLNEGFLDSIVRFFKGIFDLFNDQYVKKDAEESQKYFTEIENDEDVPDEDVQEEIDPKRVRKISDNMNKNIKKRIETDEEKGIRTSKNLTESFTSWIGMLVTYEESMNMPFIEKMTKNPELAKRFTWVPPAYTSGDKSIKDWYKDPECKPDPKVLKSLENISKSDPKAKKNLITKFCQAFIEMVVSSDERNGSKYKEQDKEYLDQLHVGLAAMANGIIESMYGVIKNTQDDKLTEVIAEEIITKRKRKGGKTGTKQSTPTASSGNSGEGRSRKGSKKTTTNNKK